MSWDWSSPVFFMSSHFSSWNFLACEIASRTDRSIVAFDVSTVRKRLFVHIQKKYQIHLDTLLFQIPTRYFKYYLHSRCAFSLASLFCSCCLIFSIAKPNSSMFRICKTLFSNQKYIIIYRQKTKELVSCFVPFYELLSF